MPSPPSSRGGPTSLDGLDEAEQRDFTAFEGNAQGFRIISSLSPGLRLTFNTLAAFTKYPKESVVRGGYSGPGHAARRDQKKYGAFQSERAVLEALMTASGMPRLSEEGLAFARHPFAFLVEAADDVCYLIIDLEDAVRLDVIGFGEVEESLEAIISAHPDGPSHHGPESIQRDANDRISLFRARAINSLIFQCAAAFGDHLPEIAAGGYAGSLTKEIPGAAALERIAEVSMEKLYRYRPVLEIEAAGFEVLDGLLDSLVDAALSKRDARRLARLELFPDLSLPEGLGRYEVLRRITDYVAGMTDGFALSTFRKLRGMELPKMY